MLVGFCAWIRRHYQNVGRMVRELDRQFERLPRLLAHAGPVPEWDDRKPTAIVLVNSQSPDYTPGFQHLIQPYLDHFGIPYTTLDISTTAVPATINEYSLIIIGHRNLDSGGAGFLSSAHTNDDIKATLSAAEQAYAQLIAG